MSAEIGDVHAAVAVRAGIEGDPGVRAVPCRVRIDTQGTGRAFCQRLDADAHQLGLAAAAQVDESDRCRAVTKGQRLVHVRIREQVLAIRMQGGVTRAPDRRHQRLACRAVQRESREVQTVILRVQVHQHVLAVGAPVGMVATLGPALGRDSDADLAAIGIHRDHVLGAVATLALPGQQAPWQPAQREHQPRALWIPLDVESEKIAALAGDRQRGSRLLDDLRERNQQSRIAGLEVGDPDAVVLARAAILGNLVLRHDDAVTTLRHRHPPQARTRRETPVRRDRIDRATQPTCFSGLQVVPNAVRHPVPQFDVVVEQRPVVRAPLQLRAELHVPAARLRDRAGLARFEIDDDDLRDVAGARQPIFERQARDGEVPAGRAERRAVVVAMDVAGVARRHAPHRNTRGKIRVGGKRRGGGWRHDGRLSGGDAHRTPRAPAACRVRAGHIAGVPCFGPCSAVSTT